MNTKNNISPIKPTLMSNGNMFYSKKIEIHKVKIDNTIQEEQIPSLEKVDNQIDIINKVINNEKIEIRDRYCYGPFQPKRCHKCDKITDGFDVISNKNFHDLILSDSYDKTSIYSLKRFNYQNENMSKEGNKLYYSSPYVELLARSILNVIDISKIISYSSCSNKINLLTNSFGNYFNPSFDSEYIHSYINRDDTCFNNSDISFVNMLSNNIFVNNDNVYNFNNLTDISFKLPNSNYIIVNKNNKYSSCLENDAIKLGKGIFLQEQIKLIYNLRKGGYMKYKFLDKHIFILSLLNNTDIRNNVSDAILINYYTNPKEVRSYINRTRNDTIDKILDSIAYLISKNYIRSKNDKLI